MPCVLPVIGLKIMSFVQQAGGSRREILSLNLWFSPGPDGGLLDPGRRGRICQPRLGGNISAVSDSW